MNTVILLLKLAPHGLIKITERMKFVFMALFKNSKGFIMISLSLSLLTAIIALPLLIHLFKMVISSNIYEHHSVNTFFHLINNELLRTKHYHVISNSLELIPYNDEIITFSKYNHFIRKQVDGMGHEIYLRDIKEFIVEKKKGGFKISIETLSGDIFEKRFSVYNF